MTTKQRKYYYSVIVQNIAQKHKKTSKETHSWIKFKFGIESTTQLSNLETEDLFSKIRTFASKQFNLCIPTPSEYGKPEFSN